MSVSRLVGGILCLVAAAVLLAAYLVLPAEEMMFMIGETNMAWLPPILLGITGVVLIATAWQGRSRTVQTQAPLTPEQQAAREAKIAQNKRLESIGWGFFLVMMGGSIIISDEVAPEGLWTIGVGLIMLGLNIARYFNGIRMSGFTTVLGLIAIATGTSELLGFDFGGFPFLLIIMGVYLLLKPAFEREGLFGKVEQG